jgi:putative DNA primase/helicase
MKQHDDAYEAAYRHKMYSLSARGIANAVRIAKADPRMQVDAALLDAKGYELNTLSGIVDLYTGKLGPHNRESWHTKLTATGYDPTWPTPMWDEFLDTTFEGNAGLIAFMQELAGLACIGDVTHHILPFLYGEEGNNGKSVLLNVFQYCLGTYAVVLPIAALVSGRRSHTEDMADLPGARLAVAVEVGQDTRWDEEKIKTLTGGDRYTVRAIYGRKRTIDHPTHLIMIAANDKPRVASGGKSFYRRFKIIPFNHTMPDDQINVHLAREMFDREGPGILAWMVAGAVNVIRDGLHQPPEVTDATAEYAESEDEVSQWIDECTLPAPGFPQPQSKLYTSYRSLCASNGIEPRTSQGFGVALTRHGIAKGDRQHGGVRTRVGLKLIRDPDAIRDPHDRDDDDDPSF